jgi:hypothetical protein
MKTELVWEGKYDEFGNSSGTLDPAAWSDIDLLLYCIGAIYHWDIPFFLEEHRYAVGGRLGF